MSDKPIFGSLKFYPVMFNSTPVADVPVSMVRLFDGLLDGVKELKPGFCKLSINGEYVGTVPQEFKETYLKEMVARKFHTPNVLDNVSSILVHEVFRSLEG